MRVQAMEQSKVIFNDRNGSRLEISASALTTMNRFRQAEPDQFEAGGILLGRLIDSTGDLVVDEATVPDKSDRRSRFNFFRSKRVAQQRINSAWRETNQTRNYLGEWHTHPEDCPTPSGHDVENWKRIVNKSKFEQEALVFVIVGRTTISAWSLRKGEQRPSQLQRIVGRKTAKKETE
jgi:integrative and conjugative element protein (TIGR02256 family)